MTIIHVRKKELEDGLKLKDLKLEDVSEVIDEAYGIEEGLVMKQIKSQIILKLTLKKNLTKNVIH